MAACEEPQIENLYEILNIHSSANKNEITMSWQGLIRMYHPDNATDEDNKKWCEDYTQKINEAYKILSNEESRKKYDASLNIGSSHTDLKQNFENFENDGSNREQIMPLERLQFHGGKYTNEQFNQQFSQKNLSQVDFDLENKQRNIQLINQSRSEDDGMIQQKMDRNFVNMCKGNPVKFNDIFSAMKTVQNEDQNGEIAPIAYFESSTMLGNCDVLDASETDSYIILSNDEQNASNMLNQQWGNTFSSEFNLNNVQNVLPQIQKNREPEVQRPLKEMYNNMIAARNMEITPSQHKSEQTLATTSWNV